MKFHSIARRDLLRAAASTGLALPLFQSARGFRSAQAAPSMYPQRLIIYATTNSGWPEQFWPTLPGKSPIPLRPAASDYTSGLEALDTKDFALSPILAPLQKHRERMLILEGVDGYEGGHSGYGSLFSGVPGPNGETGTKGDITVDHLLAKELNLANQTKFPSLQFGVKALDDDGDSAILSFYGPNKPAPPVDDPSVMFERVFGGFANNPVDKAAKDKAAARRLSILDASTKQLMDLQAKLPLREDRDKLGGFLESIRSVEKTIGSSGGANTLTTCGKPATPMKLDFLKDENAPLVAKAQMETMVQAMACDLTRVATFQFYAEGNNFGHPWLGITKGHHNDLGHGDPADLDLQKQILKIETWQSEQMAYLLDRLLSIKEGAGTMLDNTLVVFMQTHTRGHAHSNTNLNLVLAGNLGGNVLKQGRYIRFKRAAKGGKRDLGHEASTELGLARTSSDLCFTIMQCMGLSPKGFGLPARFTGGLPEIKA